MSLLCTEVERSVPSLATRLVRTVWKVDITSVWKMYIKTITLEGFKSYRDRTVIGPFDRHFNAITGLNGSGKSNILDAICFVLGVNSLTTVRATCLADLIYKGAGVSRASVSISFDNSDKSPGKCPPGFEDFPEIIVSRVVDQGLICKYYLNSLNSTKNAVSDMFQHVGININHPNFIIMQGKITKVVNMKPLEVLQMIEETCGATAYQKKRDRIERDITDRERKMEGMAKMIQEVILPALDQQNKASVAVQEYHLTQRELNDKEKSLAVVSYLYYYKNLEKAKKELDNLRTSEDNEIKDIENGKREIDQLKERQEDISRRARGDKALERITKEYDEMKKPHHQKEAQVNSATLNVQEAKDKVSKAQQEYKKESNDLQTFRSRSEALINEFETIKQEIQVAEENVAKVKDKEEKINQGNVVTESGDVVNVNDKLNNLIATLTESKSRHDYLKKEFTSLTKSVQEKTKQLQSCPRDDETEQTYKTVEANVKRLENLLRQHQIDPQELPNLENLIYQAKQDKVQLERKQSGIKQRYPYLDFTYDNPTPNFNPQSVIGLVYELFKVKDLNKFGGAIEVGVGGSLSKIVVDSQQTSKLLISKGNLQRRLTFLPMDVVQGRPPPPNLQADLDRTFGPGKAFVAVDLVEFEPAMSKIIHSIFGSLVITQDLATAKAVAFNMKFKAVSLEGEVADPGGTMQGGTRNNFGGLIQACQELRSGSLAIRQCMSNLAKLQSQHEVCLKNQKLITEHAEATRALKQIQDIRALTTRATLTEELAVIQRQFNEKEVELKSLEKTIQDLTEEERSYQDQLKNEDSLRQKNLKQITTELKKWESALTTAKKKYESKKTTFEYINVELNAKKDFLSGFQKDIDEAEAEVKECEEALQKKQNEFKDIDSQFQLKQQELLKARAANKELEAECQKIGKRIDDLSNKIHELEIAQLKRETILKDHQNKVTQLDSGLQRILEENRGTDFNPEMQCPTNKPVDVLAAEVKALKKKHEDMRHRLDFEKAAALITTKNKVSENQKLFKETKQTRRKIEKTIKCLDDEKLKMVKEGYTQINAEFDMMMGILLPDSHAKLVPVNERNLMEGMNIHVKLGGVWKESLTELSGGQRSLVALALVLSLCMYNPAPFYVLDEIDAALDLSHTQNIGYLLRNKFRTTQFVCVSLKDGMYSNANVLFQTQLLNGTSVVKRQAAAVPNARIDPRRKQ
ncbi:unnamed protein product [Allacma fusca]|uniref:Structural maintenance of chromosomes protein n=1 Tax=Allacma fusca TaxID=39272 RepID=A0A8J2JZH5_9HEXA|nr:unnamed protein product [Allacma fusca]